MKRVAEACDAAMPRKRPSNRRASVYWWSDAIAECRRKCLRTRRMAQRRRGKQGYHQLLEIHRESKRQLVRAIKSSKGRCWQELLDEVQNDPWGRPYKVVTKRLKRQDMPAVMGPEIMGRIVTALFPRQPALPAASTPMSPEDIADIPPVSISELRAASARLGNSKAPGLDGIPNVALKLAIKEAPELFLSMYNRCMREGVFPAQWKRQRLVLLPKGKKKPLGEPSSYRPLCMLDSAGKILERIIYGRIEAVTDQQLSERQFGLRKGRSTLDAIDLILRKAREAISGQRWKGGDKQYCLVVTLDIRNAFNAASWIRITEALASMNVPRYLQRLVANYFSDRVLKYDTDEGPKDYMVTGGVPQGSVLGPLLWNIMYDGLLRLRVPRAVTMVAFADDVALVIVAKHLDEARNLFHVSFHQCKSWMEQMGLELAEQKTEALLITGRKKIETITLKVGQHRIVSKPSIRYLGVQLDARLEFKAQVDQASVKAAAVTRVLSRLMPNVGGPRQKRRALLTSVTTSVMTYGIALWAEALETKSSCRKLQSVHRLSALRVAGAFCTISREAAEVISGLLPIRILADERKRIFKWRKSSRNPEQEATHSDEEQSRSLEKWQSEWEHTTKGRWTYRLIPHVGRWVNREHGEVNYYLTQLLSGHGCFRAYLHKYKHEESPACPACVECIEDAEHVFFGCPRYAALRQELERELQVGITPDTVTQVMISSQEAWQAVNEFASQVLKDLRIAEQRRRKEEASRLRRESRNPETLSLSLTPR